MKHIQALIQAYGLSHIENEILEAVFSCIKIVPARDEAVRPGMSKAGGAAHLPPDATAPEGLAFLCQLNLKEVSAAIGGAPLPESGILSFFYGNGHTQVLFHDAADTVESGAALYPECAIRFELAEKVPQLFIEDEEDDLKFLQMLEELEPDHYDNHQMFGVPFSVHGEVLEELADELGLPPEDMVLLLQLDSDAANFGMSWGEMGMLYFCMTQQDLAERRFDRVYALVQSL